MTEAEYFRSARTMTAQEVKAAEQARDSQSGAYVTDRSAVLYTATPAPDYR